MIQQENTYIKKIQNGETDSFGHLVSQHGESVFLLILRIVRNREDAEELTQDVFLKVYRTLDTFKSECLFSTWLYRIAYNTAISATRKRKQEFLYLEEQTIENISDDTIDHFFESHSDRLPIEALTEALNRLPPDERAIITLFYLEQKTIEDIASVTSLSLANVKVKLHRIRKKLYAILSKRDK